MTIKHLYPTQRPSLDLNFARTKRLDPRITYSRASSGTYVNENGVIQSTATNTPRFDHDPETGESLGLLVEEGRTNLQKNSNAPYTTGGVNVTLTPNHLALDGTATAVLYTENTAASQHYHQVNIFPSPTFAAGTYTFSVFVKSNGSNRVSIKGPATETVTFDLSTVTVVSAAGSTCSITNAGNGWFRCSVTRSVGSSITQYQYYAGLNSDTGSGFESYTGDGISGAYFWGWQIEAGSFPTSYIPTPATFTSRASTATYYDSSGVIQTAAIDVARDNAYFPDENGVFRPAGLLLEGSGTNLLTYSEQFDNAAWTKTNTTIPANATTAPDGTLTAEKLTSSTGTWPTFIHQTFGGSGIRTLSVFAKAGDSSWFAMGGIGAAGEAAYFNLSTGTVGTKQANVTSAAIEKLPNGWYRCSVTCNFQSYGGFIPVSGDNTINISPIGQGIYIWGAQIEASPYPTSYIPTAGSTVTRSADVSTSSTVTRAADVASITGSNFSSWYNQSEGTILISQKDEPDDPSGTILEIGGTTGNYAYSHSAHVINAPATTYLDIRSYLSNGGTPSGFFYAPRTPPATIAYAYEEGNYGLAKGGVSIPINGGGWNQLVPTVDSYLGLGRLRGGSSTIQLHIARLTYYPTRLSNAILQTLTS